MSHFTTNQTVTAADLNALHPLLAEATADGLSATLSIASIPQTHRDLIVRCHGSNSGSSLRAVVVTVNGNAANYRYVRIQSDDNGTPTTQASQSALGWDVGAFGDDADLSSLRLEIPDYSAATNQSTMWQAFGTSGTTAGTSRSVHGSGGHVQSAAVTSIQLTMSVDNWRSGSTLKVYGDGLI